MKNIKNKLIDLFRGNYCTPKISKIAKKLREPSTTIHYNIKKLEKEEVIKTYKAVFDYKKINEGYCVFVLINLSSKEYSNPERIAKDFLRYKEIESIDIIAGDWEMVLKIRVKDQEEYYSFIKNVISRDGVEKIKSLTSLKQLKSEFVNI